MRLAEEQQRRVHEIAALLLGYPDQALLARLPELTAAARETREPAASLFDRLLRHLRRGPLLALQQLYVRTFDLNRRCCLYLTYYTHGDTRQRGAALLQFRQAYRAAGLDPASDELPDHLAVVLEFSAHGGTAEAVRLLREHQTALELLWSALCDVDSPYVDVIAAVRDTLPPPSPRDIAAALRIARNGPAAEDVGLEPFGPPPLAGDRR